MGRLFKGQCGKYCGMRRVVALAAWVFLVWGVVTWTFTLEQVVFGVAFAAAVAVALTPLGEVKGPWWFIRPRRVVAAIRLLLESSRRVLMANLRLSARIWNPRLPLASGMVIVPTQEHTDGGLTAVGLISSLIVDNQITDIDRGHGLLQYHAVSVPEGDREQARDSVNGPIERLLEPLMTHDGRPARDDRRLDGDR
jgi:multicomponent Na+:H+ antiporter subunit E